MQNSALKDAGIWSELHASVRDAMKLPKVKEYDEFLGESFGEEGEGYAIEISPRRTGRKKPKNPLAAMISNAELMATTRRLFELTEKETATRFGAGLLSAHKTRHSHPHACCPFAVVPNPGGDNNCPSKNPKGRLLLDYGPFLSCPLVHSRGQDYEDVSEVSGSLAATAAQEKAAAAAVEVQKGSSRNFTFGAIQLCRPTSPSFFSRSNNTASGGKVKFQCHEDFTVSGVNKYKVWSASQGQDDGRTTIQQQLYNMKQTYPLKIPKIPSQFQELNGLSLPISGRRLKPLQTIKNGSSDSAKIPKYGPCAIASVSGYSFAKKSLSSTPQPTPLTPKVKPATAAKNKANTEEVIDFVIPWPSGNVRYYDDDSDPKIVDVLARAPFCVPVDEKEQLKLTLSLKNQNHIQIPSPRPQVTKIQLQKAPPPLIPDASGDKRPKEKIKATKPKPQKNLIPESPKKPPLPKKARPKTKKRFSSNIRTVSLRTPRSKSDGPFDLE